MKSKLPLKDFQISGIHNMCRILLAREEHAVYNADEMGLGKTVQTLYTVKGVESDTTLIISPAVMRLTWEAEINKWMPGQRIKVISSGADKFDPSEEYDFVITSYGLAMKEPLISALKSYLMDYVHPTLVLDEAHYLKSTKAKRTKAILKELWVNAHYKIALSGTPFTKSVIDGYTLFSRMAPEFFNDWFAFANRYTYKRMVKIGPREDAREVPVYYGVKNAEELSKKIRSTFYIRRRKEEVLKELPDKTYSRIVLPEKYAVQSSVSAADILRILEAGGSVPPSLADATKRMEQGLKKVPAIVEFVSDMLEEDVPVVLFAWHKSVIAKLAEELKKYKPVIITGETSGDERFKAVGSFQAGETNLFIGNIVAAGVGITLTRSSTVVLAELTWSPAEISQAVDRAHRIGSKSNVTVYYFIVKDSIDEKIAEVVINKANTFARVLD